jgi:hypothetical protein
MRKSFDKSLFVNNQKITWVAQFAQGYIVRKNGAYAGGWSAMSADGLGPIIRHAS